MSNWCKIIWVNISLTLGTSSGTLKLNWPVNNGKI